MHKIKTITELLIKQEIYKPQIKLANETDPASVHPFSGFLGQIVSLICNLSYQRDTEVEQFWLDEKRGWPILGLILSYTKIDYDNPTLREWCLLFIRHITSWSADLRKKLEKLTLISTDAGDLES